MRQRRLWRSVVLALACAGFLVLVLPRAGGAGTTGKIAGRVLDSSKQPLVGANVTLVGVSRGAATDLEGRYLILNVPAGTYEVRFSLIGYRAVAVQNVTVSADNTTKLDMTLQESPVELKEVVVSAQRPVVDVGLTSNIASLTRAQIETLPVQELQDVVNLQAGVVDGHFRGGRQGEVQYQVDGITVNNVYDNVSSIRLDRSLLEEVQVISGTFDAEYGQAMSGVVNAVLKRGTDTFGWSGEVLDGAFVFPGSDRPVDYTFRPAGIRNFQLTLSGPTGLAKTVYLLNARRYAFEDYVEAKRVFFPTVYRDSSGVSLTRGDDHEEPLAYNREWSGILKLSNRSLPNIEVSYQALLDQIDARRLDWTFRYNPDGLAKQSTWSLVHGLDWTHTLSAKTFYKLAVRQNLKDYHEYLFEDVNDPRYDADGPALSVPRAVFFGDTVYNVVVGGADLTRFKQETDAWVVSGSYVNQTNRDHQIKLGGEAQFPRMRFGAPGYLKVAAVGIDFERPPVSPEFPGVSTYRPLLGAAYVQDDVEWNDLKLRAGLRLDYFDARSTLPGDLRNPADALDVTGDLVPDTLPPRATTVKLSVSPRLGVSYPISERAAIYFAYGHFYQMPPLRDVFTNANYQRLAGLAAGTGDKFGVLGNPDIRPERTVQYQLGYKDMLSDVLGLDLNVYYKDIRDLIGVEFVSTYNDAQYARMTNVDFGSVFGFTLALDRRPVGLLSWALDYTWQLARGNSSEPNETFTRAQGNLDPRPRQMPLNWDQRHTLNLTLTLARPERFSASAIVRVASGQPYTPEIATYGGGLESNSGRKPSAVLVDLRAERNLKLGTAGVGAFARVFNVFDQRYLNGVVFANSGSPYYSRTPTFDQAALADPTRLYAPRRVEVGLSFGGGAQR